MKSTGHILREPKRAGFTLIELIVVLFLMSIVVGFAGLYIGKDTGSLDLKKFTKEVSVVLRYARSHAVSKKKIYCFVIDQDEQRYWLYSEDTDYTNVDRVMDKEIPEGLSLDMQGSGREEVYMEFFPGGNTSGGVIEITNMKGSKFFVIANRITGKITVEKE